MLLLVLNADVAYCTNELASVQVPGSVPPTNPNPAGLRSEAGSFV